MEIQNFPNYLIYDDGRIFSKYKNKFLSQKKSKTGYYLVQLCHNKIHKMFLVHRLVAIHYIPNLNNYPQVDHIDRNKLNNDSSNLRWVNNSMNSLNRGYFKRNDNKWGHTRISYTKSRNTWRYRDRRKNIQKDFKNKIDCLCYKFICILKYPR